MKLIATVVVLLAAALPTTAYAGTVVGSTTDPVDQPPALSGDATPDITSVGVSYDSTGTVGADVAFTAPVSTVTPDNLSVMVGSASAACIDGLFLFAPMSASATGLVSRTGTTGNLPVAVTWNATRTAVHLQASNAGLGGGTYDCAAGSTSIPDPYGHCAGTNCSYISYTYTLDDVPMFGLADPTASVQPAAPLAPVVRKTTLTVAAKASTCLRQVVVLGSSMHRATDVGRIRYTLQGPGLHRVFYAAVELGDDVKGHQFKRLRPGRYTLTARYLGGVDATANPAAAYAPSNTVSKRFTIKKTCG